ncbi:MAG: hypothetical protein SXA11_06945 [Cyanobacteriota bacterium]|nr:hypothetical protein [Cyanobacteriota bacterium]
MAWNHTQQTTIQVTSSALARGAYSSDPTAHSVTDTVGGIEIVADASIGQYFSISNSGPDPVYCRFGGVATSSVFSVIFPPGFNDNEMRVAANENVTVITAAGETAEILVNIAPEVQI